MALPELANSMMSWVPSVMPAPTSRSSALSSSAMMPLVRGREKAVERRLLDRAAARGEEHELILFVGRHGQHGINALVFLERQQIHDRAPARPRARLRYLVDLQPIHFAAAREAQQRVVRVGHEQLIDEVLVLHSCRGPAATSAALGLIGPRGLRLGIAGMRERDHHRLFRDQVLDGQVVIVLDDLGAPWIGILRTHFGQLVADHALQPIGTCQDLEEIVNTVYHLIVFVSNFILLEPGQSLQAQIQNRLGLGRRQTIALGRYAIGLFRYRRAASPWHRHGRAMP